MPSTVRRLGLEWRSTLTGAACCALLLAGAGLVALGGFGCTSDGLFRGRMSNATSVYPPSPQTPRVFALGTIRGGSRPTEAQNQLSVFLFGTEPPPPLTIATPTGLAARGDELLICDSALGAVFHWDSAGDTIREFRPTATLSGPYAVDIAANGDRLIAARGGVVRVTQDGRGIASYRLEGEAFRPGAVLDVGSEVWVANLALHRIEVFDAASGKYLQSIGRRGAGPGEFAMPRDIARAPDGDIYVVDTLNNRVQVLSPEGDWVRDIGGPGDVVGTFGRPKGVAIGPDGAIFVTDAFSQRVHVFDADGRPLLAFGEPNSGPGQLALPAGIAIAAATPTTTRALPDDKQSAYYVLVAEQLHDPGVRVYAWLGDYEVKRQFALPTGVALGWEPRSPEMAAINPHWDASRCDKCHERGAGGGLLPIEPTEVDALCLSCHDGVRAPADPHPIGRPANTAIVQTPEEFPTVEGDITCLTCHDIQRHCSNDAKRPAVNYVLLREYDPQSSLQYCIKCHTEESGSRFSPHRQRDESGRIRDDACLFCHTRRPEVPADGRRRFEPHLREVSSQLCMNCHAPHWDLSPEGHVDRPVTPRIKQWMLVRELHRDADTPLAQLLDQVAKMEREPARLPLGDDKVTCYSCHNPHYAGLFPEDSELGSLAKNPRDRAAGLRTDWIDLCSECHHR